MVKDKSMPARASGDAAPKEKAKRVEAKGPGISGFIRESVAELKKVHAPTRQETMQATLVTLAIVLFFAVVLAVLDWAFRGLVWRLV